MISRGSQSLDLLKTRSHGPRPHWALRLCPLVLLILATCVSSWAWSQEAKDVDIKRVATTGDAKQSSATVGMRQRLKQVVLPGSELTVVEIDDRSSPLILGIEQVYPHGSAFRYDFVFQGLEPGSYDLTQWLRRKDGTPVKGLPPIPVEVTGLLPPGQIEPNPPAASIFGRFGGYRLLIMIGTIVWLVAGWLILFQGRSSKSLVAEEAQVPRTLADRLRPVVQRARRGELTRTELAELERLLLAYWRRRLGMEELPLAESTRLLKAHAEAGPLIQALENWLHKEIAPDGGTDAAMAALLTPYEQVRADELDSPGNAGSLLTGQSVPAQQGVGR